MRIIAGKHKSRILETLDGLNTRPMMDQMKEAVFNCIGPYFDELEVLDLFSGSGALSLEAISRGARHSTMVELNYKACQVIRKNINTLNEQNNITLYNMDYQRILKKLITEKKQYDLIFLDPPYKMNVIKDIVDQILDNDLLSKEGIIVAHYQKGTFNPTNDKINIKKTISYGSNEVTIYQSNE